MELKTKYNIVSFEYEVIDNFHARYKVFGGWIVENYDKDVRNGNLRTTMVFIPDPDHEWRIKPGIEVTKKRNDPVFVGPNAGKCSKTLRPGEKNEIYI